MISAKEELFSLETDELSLQEAEGSFRAWGPGFEPRLFSLGRSHLTSLSLFVYKEGCNCINIREL